MTSPISPSVGDSVFLGDIPFIAHCFGVLSDLDTPDQVSASLEIFGSNGALSLSALMGPPGPAGSSAPVGKLQFIVYDDEDDLPTNLTEDDVDIGKYWIVRKFDDDANEIGSNWYIWYGDHYERFMMGTAGPVGPVPKVTFTFELVTSAVTATTKVTKTGDDFNPSILVQINEELIRGPQGVMGDMEDLSNWDGTVVAETGDTPIYNATTGKWGAQPSYLVTSKVYTMPEAAFVDVPLAINTRVPLGTFVIPPQDFDCIPWVFGHMRVTGVEADADPFIIGCEVRLGTGGASGGGTLVARGYGNISSYTNVMPHASGSDSGTAGDAIAPGNGRAVIPAGTTGTAATLYINAFNDGLAGIYNFSKRGAQLSIDLRRV